MRWHGIHQLKQIYQSRLSGPGSWMPVAGCFAVASFGVIALAFICPVTFGQAAQAEAVTATTATDTTVFVQPAVAVSLQSRIDIGIIPRSGGVFKSETAELTVSTNNTTGYGLYLKTTGDDNSLHNTIAPEQVIAPVTADSAANDFGKNTWGYHLGTTPADADTVYSAVPTAEGAALASSDQTATKDVYQLTFGTNVDIDLPAGEYTNSVLVSVVANPMEITSLTQLTYMQDMTADICNISAENATTQLIDTRDGNKYWVAKLKDGKCWMTQNLALELGRNADGRVTAKNSGVVLNANNSDIEPTTNFTLSYETTNDASVVGMTDTGRSIYYDRYILNSLSPDKTADVGLSNEIYYTNVGDPEWRDTYVATDTKAVEENSKTYDAHYLLGAFYQRSAAIAGSANGTQSICPKGWKLWLNGTNAATSDFATLLPLYGFSSSSIVGETSVITAPLYLAEFGYVGGYTYLPNNLFYWTSGYFEATKSYMASIDFKKQVLRLRSTDENRYAFNVRCIAK